LDQAAPISARPTRTRWLGAFSPVARGRDDAHALGLDAEGDDFAGELVRAGLLEGADGRHCKSPFPFRARTIAASMAIDRPEAIDGARPAQGPDG
jgi:hypothetical protein